MKVVTKDFQRLKGENTFEFPVGITVIQGRSGSGKSTLFYAIEDCLANPSGVADVINWDADNCSVTIENNDNKVTWKRTSSSCEYIDKDGKPYVKASKKDSRDIADLGFYFDKKDRIINIHNEWSTLFPFEVSDTEMFKLFEDIFNISSSFQIIESIKQDEQALKSKISDTNNQINDLTIKNNNIESILNKVDVDVDKYIINLNNIINKVTQIKADYEVLQANQKYLSINIPNEFSTSVLEEKELKYKELVEAYNYYGKYKRLSNIKLPEAKEIKIEENPYILDYNKYKSNLDLINKYDIELASLDDKENKIKVELSKIKVCPTCGQPLEGILC